MQAADLDLHKAGTLTIATDSPAYEPWFTDDDPTNGKGYEGAVARAVAEKLGFAPEKVTWVTQGFNEAIKPGAKSFDFDINQFSITSEREKVVDFSSPYYKAKQGVITLADSTYADVTSLAGLKDAKVGAQVGTTSLEATQQLGLTTDPLVYDDTTKAAQALQNGQVDAIIADVPSAFYLVAAELDGAKLVGQFEPRTGESEEFGLLLDKDSALTPCVSAAVDALKDDGTLEKLQQQWLSDAVDVPELSQS
ncbi:ABC transporter substrate-binding protein [Aeromicrobium sp.]|uniref:ABC transporter substrate-binding protein n=1 Tax=Aeromicrobium sp. TaxID=1871063 RepID=UPI003518CB87